jgi:hypothetical protein
MPLTSKINIALSLFGSPFLFDGGPFRSFACAGIRAGSLPAHRQRPPVPEPAVTPQIHESLDVHGNFGTAFAFDLVIAIDHFADGIDLGLGQIIRFSVRINIKLR